MWGALPASARGVPPACETSSRRIEILFPFCEFSRLCKAENFPSGCNGDPLFRAAMAGNDTSRIAPTLSGSPHSAERVLARGSARPCVRRRRRDPAR